MSGVYVVGEVVVLEGDFERLDTGAPMDPSSVVLTVVDPHGEQTTPTVTLGTGNPVGDWSVSFTVDVPGVWSWRLESGGLVAVRQGAVYVSPSVVSEGGS